MKFKKIIKYMVLVAIILFIGKIIFNEIFDARPFKFEKYRTYEQLDEAVKIKLPIGSDINVIIEILKDSGAECYEFNSSKVQETYKSIVSCEYTTKLFSLHPFDYYRIGILVDKNRKVYKLETLRTSGLMHYIP